MKKNFFLHSVSLISIVVFGFLMTGCPDSKDYASDLKNSLSIEKAAYLTLLRAQDQIGDSVTEAHQEWMKSLSGVNSSLSKLNHRLTDKTGEARGVQKTYEAVIERNLAALVSKSDEIHLFIPEWDFEDTYRNNLRVESLRQEILDKFLELKVLVDGAQTIDQLGALNIIIKKDPNVRSTKSDCIEKFDYVGMGAPDGGVDCKSAAREYCTHTMDLRCVQQKINIYATHGCALYETREVPNKRQPRCESSGLDKTGDTCEVRTHSEEVRVGRARWLREIQVCQNKRPYCQYGSGLQICKERRNHKR